MIAFDVEEYFPYTAAGPASLVGKVLLEIAGQAPCIGAMCPVLLFPDTLYLREVIALIRQGKHLEPSPFAEHYLPRVCRRSTCDPNGHFSFHALPALPYIAAADFRSQDDEPALAGIIISSIRLGPGLNYLVLTNAKPLEHDRPLP